MSVESCHTYSGESEINFFSDDAGLTVTIDTKRLHMRSVKINDLDRFALLFGDKEVMEKFGTGETKTREKTQERIEKWVKRWQANNPYAGLAVFEKATGRFVGHVILGQTSLPGVAEIAYLFHKANWKQHYGTEAVAALVQEYAPATVQEGYTIKDKPLEKIVATARVDNPASFRILEKVGMHYDKTEERFGAPRAHYSIEITQKNLS